MMSIVIVAFEAEIVLLLYKLNNPYTSVDIVATSVSTILLSTCLLACRHSALQNGWLFACKLYTV